MEIAAHYYDGQSARRHRVQLTLQQGVLQLRGESVTREVSASEFKIPAALGNTRRLILLADGGRCEIADTAAFDAWLAETHRGHGWLARLEARWSYACIALALMLVIAAVTYLWGLPYLAQQAAERVPSALLARMDREFMHTFDEGLLRRSKLPAARQAAIASRIQTLRLPANAVAPTAVLFRSAPMIGPNAFALPGGNIIILDEIVALSDHDEQIVAVAAHELGHVAGRHALRQMLQASAVGLAAAWYLGDVSSLLAGVPATLLETRYSRDFERNADAFGAATLTLNGIPPARLAEMLEKLEKADGEQDDAQGSDYLSSHPATPERIRALRGQR